MLRMHLIYRSILIFLVLSAFAAQADAQADIRDLEARLKSAPRDQKLLIELGRLYHDRGVAGDDAAVERAFDLFNRAIAEDSSNAVSWAYRGSLWTLRARESWWPPTKLNGLRKGNEDFDEAVSLEPTNIMVRLIRGMSGLSLPSFYGRLPKALEDFIVILRSPDFPEQRRELKVAVFYYAGVACKRSDDFEKARELFRLAISTYPGSEFAKKAGEELIDIGS